MDMIKLAKLLLVLCAGFIIVGIWWLFF